MVVKIKTSQIGLKKPINVHANLKNVDKADEMMIALLSLNVDAKKLDQASDTESDDNGDQALKQNLEMLQKERAFTKKALNFLQDILKLSNKQLDIIQERVDYSALGEYLGYVCNRIKGVPESAFEGEAAKTAPKEPSANSGEK